MRKVTELSSGRFGHRFVPLTAFRVITDAGNFIIDIGIVPAASPLRPLEIIYSDETIKFYRYWHGRLLEEITKRAPGSERKIEAMDGFLSRRAVKEGIGYDWKYSKPRLIVLLGAFLFGLLCIYIRSKQ